MGFEKVRYLVFGMAALCLLLSIIASQAKADEITQPQAKPIAAHMDPVHILIDNHFSAIKQRDADQAFAMTTSSFHEKYDTAGEFLGRMRFDFRQIYNHKSYKFLERRDLGDAVLQKVEISDRYGEPAIVIYRLEEDEEGHLLIDSFTILDTHGQAI